MRKQFTLIFFICAFLMAKAQDYQSLIITSDIDRFWMAYDSAGTTTDTLKQQQFFQQLYIDKATEGLKSFMKICSYDAPLYVRLIKKYPKFWPSVRKNTLMIKSQLGAVENSIRRFKALYPEMNPAKVYFTVGGLRSGGTVTSGMVLVGSEIATADKDTDASELSSWLQKVFKSQAASYLLSVNVHEYIHTQQDENYGVLLGQCLREGAADFITELVTEQENKSPYLQYGRAHEPELKARFKTFMFSGTMNEWLYNGGDVAHPDLGYFMGYQICQAYYRKSKDKKLAIKKIITLNYGDRDGLLDFLTQSGYYRETINKNELMKEFEAKQPEVQSLSPDLNLKDSVSASLSELSFNFSEPMNKTYFLLPRKGKGAQYPISGTTGFSEDLKSFKVKLNLQPGKTYELTITGKDFISQRGYPLKEYKLRFSTK